MLSLGGGGGFVVLHGRWVWSGKAEIPLLGGAGNLGTLCGLKFLFVSGFHCLTLDQPGNRCICGKLRFLGSSLFSFGTKLRAKNKNISSSSLGIWCGAEVVGCVMMSRSCCSGELGEMVLLLCRGG